MDAAKPGKLGNRALSVFQWLIPLLLCLVPARAGLDFGWHPDEWFHTQRVINALNGESFGGTDLHTDIPYGSYIYPGVPHILSLIPVLPHMVNEWAKASTGIGVGMENSKSFVEAKVDYLVARRFIFIFVAALSVPWVYFQVRAMGRSGWEAMLAGLVLALSWEYGYHCRWVAPDCIMAQFVALALVGCLRFYSERARTLPLYLAAAAAGLATGSKYPGGLALLPVLIVVFQTRAGLSWAEILTRYLKVGAVFVVTYLLTTPGTVMTPGAFIRDVRCVTGVYSAGWFGYTVKTCGEHLEKMLAYFTTASFSHYFPLAIILFAVAVYGAVILCRESPRVAVLFLCVPVIYVAYFSLQRAMIVRNLMVILPFVAVLIARGVASLHERVYRLPFRIAVVLTVAAMLTVNLSWILYAANCVRHRRDIERFGTEMQKYVENHPKRHFLVSNRVFQVFESRGHCPLNISRTDTSTFDEMIFFASELQYPNLLAWPVNRPGRIKEVFGPWEKNYNYYQWPSDDAIMVVTKERASRFPFDIVGECRR